MDSSVGNHSLRSRERLQQLRKPAPLSASFAVCAENESLPASHCSKAFYLGTAQRLCIGAGL
jgi:hypothetical protein